MGIKLSAEELELYNYVDETLFFKWDPIGISNDPVNARTEYRMYLPRVYSMLKEFKTAMEIADFLTGIEKDRMGLTPTKQTKNRNLEIAIDLKAFFDK